MSGQSRPRIFELDGLRAVAVLLVILDHYGPVRSLPLAWRLRQVGWVGVGLFFVLSGFLITGILLETVERPGYFRNFYARRTLRIFPLYYLVLTSTIVVMQVVNHGQAYAHLLSNWGHPLWLFLYVGNVRDAVVGGIPKTFALVPFWSLQVEEQFYLIFPLMVYLMSPRTLMRVLFVSILISPLLRLALWYLYPENPFLQYTLLPCRMEGLALGAAIAIRSREPWALHKGVLVALTVCAWVLAYGSYVYLGGNVWNSPFTRIWDYSLFPAAFAATLLCVLVFRGSWATRWLAMPPARYIGKISYGIYLLQAPVATVLADVLHTTPLWRDELSRFAAIASVTVLLASASWYAFEQPILRLQRRFGDGVSPGGGFLARTAS